jgi:hypothetical protein
MSVLFKQIPHFTGTLLKHCRGWITLNFPQEPAEHNIQRQKLKLIFHVTLQDVIPYMIGTQWNIHIHRTSDCDISIINSIS